jgi:hypothetical protein
MSGAPALMAVVPPDPALPPPRCDGHLRSLQPEPWIREDDALDKGRAGIRPFLADRRRLAILPSAGAWPGVHLRVYGPAQVHPSGG